VSRDAFSERQSCLPDIWLNSSLAMPPEFQCVSVQEGYERWAQTYDNTPNPLLALEERHLIPFLPDLKGRRVLDLACGTGRWLARLLARGASAGVGVDVSASMLRVAATKSAITGRLVLADCLQLPLRPSVFDFVLCSFALNHIQKLGVMARELARQGNDAAAIANYRDAIYLAYGSSVPAQLSGFVDDMLVVLKAFAAMAGAFCSMRVGKVSWTEFIDDLERKKAISVSPKDVW